MKLHEVAIEGRAIHPDLIKRWLDNSGVVNYTIRPDNTIDVDGDVKLPKSITHIPLQFGKVDGAFSVRDCKKLKSLRGSPHTVTGSFTCSGTVVDSLQFAPKFIGKHCYTYASNINSLSGIDKTIHHIGGGFAANIDVTHILGLLLIDGLQSVDISTEINRILKKYMGTRDILSAQDELIDAGFKEQARL